MYEANTCVSGARANVLCFISPSKLYSRLQVINSSTDTSPLNLKLIIFSRPLLHLFSVQHGTVLTCQKKKRGFVSCLADGPLAKSAGIPHGRMFYSARPEKACALLSRASCDTDLDGLGLVLRQSPPLDLRVLIIRRNHNSTPCAHRFAARSTPVAHPSPLLDDFVFCATMQYAPTVD